MSLVTFKNKSMLKHKNNLSGKKTGGYFLSQGPFGQNTTKLQLNYAQTGFSINGGYRYYGYIGKTSHMSTHGTRFKGIFPYGNGGHYGNYTTPLPVFNTTTSNVSSSQHLYIKPSVLSNKTMLSKKYRYIYTGQYPNTFVKPNFTGNLTDNTSQQIYLHNLKNIYNTCNRCNQT